MAPPVAPRGFRSVAVIDVPRLEALVPEIRRRAQVQEPTQLAARARVPLGKVVTIGAVPFKVSTRHFYSNVAKAVGIDVEEFSEWELFRV